eukprot:SAG22_NODE_1809_length_3528_cov_5.927676_2_plen_69_part_00
MRLVVPTIDHYSKQPKLTKPGGFIWIRRIHMNPPWCCQSNIGLVVVDGRSVAQVVVVHVDEQHTAANK